MIEANSLKRGVKPGVYLQGYYLFCCYLVAKSHPTICDPTDCGLPGFSTHATSQAGILEWVAAAISRVSS